MIIEHSATAAEWAAVRGLKHRLVQPPAISHTARPLELCTVWIGFVIFGHGVVVVSFVSRVDRHQDHL